jgi:2-polyprenyl-3-methyl-5-hydroxy-6-metoxy-1,4-benzoquinol methylase
MRVSFKPTEETGLLWKGYSPFVERLATHPRVKKVCDVGGGANPALSLDFIERNELDYVLLDISAEELAKAPDGYMKVQADIASPSFDVAGRNYDLVFSRMVAEHIRNGRYFHTNVWRLLAKEGLAFHAFPTLYAPPFVINRLLPRWLSKAMLLLLQPHRKQEGKRAKFPAYYSWCRGPTSRQIRRLKMLGYRVEEYVGFYGHRGYYHKIKPLVKVHDWISATLVKHPLPLLTSYAYVLLSKEAE